MRSPQVRLTRPAWPGVVLAALLLALAAPLAAQDEGETRRTCISCHDETDEYPVFSIMKSKHAMAGDPRTPWADQNCVNCHGASLDHMRSPSRGTERAKPDLMFGTGPHSSPAMLQNETCTTCHENSSRMHWRGSVHDREDVTCTSCHLLHTGNDPVLAVATEHEVCLSCHKDKRADLHRPYGHPILEGQMGCSDCHNPHGSSGPTQLTGTTINETCYQCHAEKRGPFLWEHGPVREDCTLCHKPHGSTQASMLKSRAPWLCQECHMAQQHPSTAYSGTGLPTAATPSGAQQILGKNCLNCHSQVHGSNHPSGVRKTR
jgi:DmsE family decaheme c-type cytochrome